jgi:hypothetical protein
VSCPQAVWCTPVVGVVLTGGVERPYEQSLVRSTTRDV